MCSWSRPLTLAAVSRPAPQRGVRVRRTTLCRRGVAAACFAAPKLQKWGAVLGGRSHLWLDQPILPHLGVKPRELGWTTKEVHNRKGGLTWTRADMMEKWWLVDDSWGSTACYIGIMNYISHDLGTAIKSSQYHGMIPVYLCLDQMPQGQYLCHKLILGDAGDEFRRPMAGLIRSNATPAASVSEISDFPL